MMRPAALILVPVLLALAATGCQSYRTGANRTVGEFTDDLVIQSRVKLALINDDDIKGLRIDTEVHRGVVTLQGRVASHELKQRAVELARSIKGVERVEDRLTVGPDGEGASP